MEFLITAIVAVIFLVGVVSSCPSVCQCTGHSYGGKVYCNSRGLDSIPTNYPNNTYELQLQYNNISVIENNTFNNLPRLHELQLHHNNISVIEKNAFNNLPNLGRLFLDYNKISSLQSSIFNDLPSLYHLRLGHNSISVIEDKAFNNLSNLRYISLRTNQITSIQSGIFDDFPNLFNVLLQNNNISVIENNAFSNLPRLLYLWLHNNKISVIENNAFNNLPKLDHLTLYNNNISVIENNTFNNLPKLERLYLHNNSISVMEDNAFNNLAELEYLHLSHNKITSIKSDMFNNLPKLRRLDLHYNDISVIEDNTFSNLQNLRYLYLHNNSISVIEDNAFNNLTELEYLHLHHNKITSIKSDTFNNLTNLIHLELQYNDISVIEDNTFSNLQNLRYLDLHYNDISVIEDNAFSNLPSLKYLLLGNNTISVVNEKAFVNLPQLPLLEFDMHCGSCDNIPFWRWLKEDQIFTTSITCNDFDGEHLPNVQLNLTDCFVSPSSLNIEHVGPNNRLLGIEDHDLTVSCKAIGGTPPPNVVLIINGQSKANNTQTVQYTLNTTRSYDHKTVTCQASNPAYSQKTLTDSVMIYLDLKPLLPTITGNVASIEETKPLVVTCTTIGSRPEATLQWTLGQKDVTSNATKRSNHIKASDTYTVISDLTYSVGKNDNGEVLICTVRNIVYPPGLQHSTILNVKYALSISVSDVTYEENEANRTVTCLPVGNPSTYTYYKWQHRSKYGLLIRELDGGQNGVLTLPSIPVGDRYQDSGEYVCTAGNGIVGRDGNVKQTGSGYVTMNAQPIFTNDNQLTQYGEFGGNVDINVYVYSIPKYTTLRWYKNDTQVSPSTKYVMSERPTIVNDTFHGKDVQLDGYSVVLTINNLTGSDFLVSYRLQLSYGVNQTVQYTVLLTSTSRPQTPVNFSLVSSTETSILVEWTPGYNDNREQTFYLEYRVRGTKTWSLKEISHNTKQLTSLTYVLSGLQDSTLYELKMYSKNMFGRRSLSTDVDIIQTRDKQDKVIQETSSSGLYGVIGGLAGVILIIIIIILGTLHYRRKKDSKDIEYIGM